MLAFNQSTSRVCVNIPIEDDDISEDPEDFTVEITSGDPDVTSQTPAANVTIVDDDDVTIGFEMEMYNSGEDQGTVQVCARIMEGSLEREVSIALQTQDGSAEEPDDYSSVSATLVFDMTNDIQCVNISIENDEILEGMEDFEVILDSGDEERVNLSPESAVVNIMDDDGKIDHVNSLIYLIILTLFFSCHHWIHRGVLQRE